MVQAAASQGSLDPLFQYTMQLAFKHRMYSWPGPLQASGLSSGTSQTEVARVAACLEDAGSPVRWDMHAAPGGLEGLGACARDGSPLDKSQLLHCYLQLELLWTLNWCLYLLGVLS